MDGNKKELGSLTFKYLAPLDRVDWRNIQRSYDSTFGSRKDEIRDEIKGLADRLTDHELIASYNLSDTKKILAALVKYKLRTGEVAEYNFHMTYVMAVSELIAERGLNPDSPPPSTRMESVRKWFTKLRGCFSPTPT